MNYPRFSQEPEVVPAEDDLLEAGQLGNRRGGGRRRPFDRHPVSFSIRRETVKRMKRREMKGCYFARDNFSGGGKVIARAVKGSNYVISLLLCGFYCTSISLLAVPPYSRLDDGASPMKGECGVTNWRRWVRIFLPGFIWCYELLCKIFKGVFTYVPSKNCRITF